MCAEDSVPGPVFWFALRVVLGTSRYALKVQKSLCIEDGAYPQKCSNSSNEGLCTRKGSLEVHDYSMQLSTRSRVAEVHSTSMRYEHKKQGLQQCSMA